MMKKNKYNSLILKIVLIVVILVAIISGVLFKYVAALLFIICLLLYYDLKIKYDKLDDDIKSVEECLEANEQKFIDRRSISSNKIATTKEIRATSESLNEDEKSVEKIKSVSVETLSKSNSQRKQYFFRKDNGHGIFVKIFNERDAQSCFSVVFTDDNMSQGEYSVIENKIINTILPGSYSSCINIDNTLYEDNGLLAECNVMNKGLVKRIDNTETWEITQKLKIKIK